MINEKEMVAYDFLFKRKNILVEEAMKLLVRVVDAKLLKGVDGEVFKPEDVEYPEKEGRVPARIGAFVDVVHEPRERPRVKSFGHGVTVFNGLQTKTAGLL